MTVPVVRLAGMPTSTLSGLRFPLTANEAEQLAAEREWLDGEGAALASDLYEPIGRTSGPAKPGLVGLRRALHQGRAPRPRERRAVADAALPEPLAARISDWMRRHTAWHHRRARLDDVLTAEHADRLQQLRDLAADPVFRRGLWHASDDLSGELDRWLTAPHRPPRRSVQFRLAKYLSRASAKSAVYSSFAVTGCGRWVPHPPPAPADGDAVRVEPAPDLRTFAACADQVREPLLFGLVRHPALWRVLWVRVNPSHLTGPGGADHRFVGPPPAEPVRMVTSHPAVRHCLDIVAAGPAGGVRMAVLVDRLNDATGAPPKDLGAFLRQLVDVGLLEVGPDSSAVPAASLAGVAAWVAAGDDPELAGCLRRLEQALRHAGEQADLADHRARHRAVWSAAERAAARVGVHLHATRAARDEVVATGPLADLTLDSGWQVALADLSAIRGWLGLFDPALPYRAALRAWWRDHHPDPADLPLLDLYQRFRATAIELEAVFTRMFLPEDLVTSPIPGLAEVGKLRSDALAELPIATGTDEPVAIPVADLAAVTRTWPAWVRPVDEMTCYLQRQGRQVVLNRLDPGYGKVTHRTGRALRHAGVDPALPAREPGPVVIAELGGLHGTALNEREPCLPYEIDYPFAASTRPAGERIRLSDLRVTRSGDGEPRLRSVSLDADVHPVYTGARMLAQLPPVAKLLAAGLGLPVPPYAVPMPFRGVPTGLRWVPRISFGSVVVRRARWAFPPELVPTRTAGETDAGYLLRLLAWRREHGIPERCFVRAWPRGDQTLPVDDRQRRAYGTLRKPFYLDFTSWFLVLAFENMLRTPRHMVVFEEALPDPSATPRVCELLIEVSGRPRGALP